MSSSNIHDQRNKVHNSVKDSLTWYIDSLPCTEKNYSKQWYIFAFYTPLLVILLTQHLLAFQLKFR